MASDVVWIDEDSERSRVLLRAVADDNVETLNRALQETDVNALHGNGQEGRTLLHFAASKGNVTVLRHLLEKGADVDALDSDRGGNSTPLHHAAVAGQPNAIRALLSRGADLQATLIDVGTPLKSVLRHTSSPISERKECLDIFLEAGSDINEPAVEYGTGTVLEQAARHGDVELAQWLLDRGAHLGESLEMAAGWSRFEMVKWLLSKGAKDPHATALSRTASCGRLDICQLIFPHAGDATPSEVANTLMIAVRNSRAGIVSFLLSQGVDMNQQDQHGHTVWRSLEINRQPDPELVKLLERYKQ